MTLQSSLKVIGTSPDKIRAEGGSYLNGSYADIAAAYNDGQVDYLYAALSPPASIFTEIRQGRPGGNMVAFPPVVRDHRPKEFAQPPGIPPGATVPAPNHRVVAGCN